ncbi:MAG: NUDIX domain-containing protein [Balneolia bacterium]|nr:NUDIX domain-containing protein [Balneolia bacterium]
MQTTKNSDFKAINAAGGVLYKYIAGELNVLLIFRNGLWDLPKGKQDEGEDIRTCAVREVSEETASAPPAITHNLGTTEHSYTDKWGSFNKTTYWYAMKTDSKHFSPQESERITKVCWKPFRQAFTLVAFDNLRTVLERLVKVLPLKEDSD